MDSMEYLIMKNNLDVPQNSLSIESDWLIESSWNLKFIDQEQMLFNDIDSDTSFYEKNRSFVI